MQFTLLVFCLALLAGCMFIGVSAIPTKRSLTTRTSELTTPIPATLPTTPTTRRTRRSAKKSLKKRAHGPGGDSGDSDDHCSDDGVLSRSMRKRAHGPGGDSGDDCDSDDGDSDDGVLQKVGRRARGSANREGGKSKGGSLTDVD